MPRRNSPSKFAGSCFRNVSQAASASSNAPAFAARRPRHRARFAVGRDKPKGGVEAFLSFGVFAERGAYRSVIVPSRFIRRVDSKRFAQRLKGVVNAAIVIEEKRFGR